MSDTQLQAAILEINYLQEYYAGDFYGTFPDATPAGLRELTADYAVNNPDAEVYNSLTRDQQREVLRKVEWVE